ncbi:hypothetical protein NJH78_00575 [Pseudomonas chlororaphis]|uniref:hypothetical protein n=1 Tax=Pseudomonas chlororaphis TaxID=587753 RepID=UPI00209B45A3|nr:hypothetical protein [Pseudomonas chlororaphis]MCO7568458.1 hypothetical protein [Pseudomonas chlororaphis]MCO7588301.1 hypothetical protein [Pseudomonas chlororaphis]
MTLIHRKAIGGLVLTILLASCASTPQHDDMLLNIYVRGATRSAPARVSAEFKSTVKDDLERYQGGASLWANGGLAEREDSYVLVPFGRYYICYEFDAKLDAAATKVDLLLFKEKGSEYRQVIAIESYRISVFPEQIDPSRDLVLTYQGPDFEPGDTLAAWVMLADGSIRVMGEWSDLVGNRLVSPQTALTIPANKLKAFPKGGVEFKFFRNSIRRFNDGDMKVEVIQFSAPVYQAVTIN